MIGYTKIGQGLFSTVYRKGNSKKVLIISRDSVKECMALDWFPNSRLFPKIDRLNYNDDGTSTYTMRYYDKVIAPKKQLNKQSYRLYLTLRNLSTCTSNPHDLYECWIREFKKLPKEFKTTQRVLIEAVEALTNYGTDIAFEISPRNIAVTKSGNLVLLDCFFMQKDALKVNK